MKICIIPARGGSKRIPGKNIRQFMGSPILAHSITTAQESGLFDHIYVTTDSLEIASVAKRHDARVIARAGYIAGDEAGTQEVTKDALERIGPTVTDMDVVCCLYATAPLTIPEDLKMACLALETWPEARFVMAVGAEPLRDAGQFYFGRAGHFKAGSPLIGPCTRMMAIPECRICDINTEEDWARAEAMYARLYPELLGMQSA